MIRLIRSRTRSRCRRSFVLIAVLVIVSSALLVATALLFVAQSQAMAAAVSGEAVSARALAWSGVAAVMSRLNDQRDRILAGQTPQVDRQYLIYDAPGRTGVIRLLPFANGALLSAEAGKLDLNSADVQPLAQTGMIDLEI